MLSTGISSLSESKSSVFLKWARVEIKRLSNQGEDKPLNPDKTQKPDDKPTPDTKPSEELKEKNLLKELSEPIILATGIVMIVVVLFCVMGMRSGNKKKKKEKVHYKKR